MGDESIQWPMNQWLYAGDYNSDTIKLHTYKNLIITNDYRSNEYITTLKVKKSITLPVIH